MLPLSAAAEAGAWVRVRNGVYKGDLAKVRLPGQEQLSPAPPVLSDPALSGAPRSAPITSQMPLQVGPPLAAH